MLRDKGTIENKLKVFQFFILTLLLSALNNISCDLRGIDKTLQQQATIKHI